MWRYFTHNNTYRYVDVLQELVSGYNASPHKGVGMAPIEVNDSNQLKIWKNMEHFDIESRLRRTPNVYVLRDLSGETLQGVFYEEQLQRVKAPDVFPISRIVRKSGKRAFVEWRGWPEKFNSWIPLSDLQKI